MRKYLGLVVITLLLFVVYFWIASFIKPEQRVELNRREEYEAIVYKDLIESRKEWYLGEIQIDQNIVESSRRKAEQMERTCEWSHDIEYDNDWMDTFRNYKGSAKGEVLARGFGRPKDVVKA